MASTTTAVAPQIRSLYRRLLRELSSTPQTSRTAHQKLSAPSKLQHRIRASISQASSQTPTPTSQQGSASPPPHGSVSSPQRSSIHSQLAHAEQCVQYVQAQRMYASLLERYNPGMGMSEEERVRLSARRVGMNLPVEFEKEGGGKGEKQ